MKTTPQSFPPNESMKENPEFSRGLILGTLQAMEQNGNFEAYGFPWNSEKEVRALSKEGLVYLNRQTERAIYAKLTDAGRIAEWVETSVTVNKVNLPPKSPTMRELLSRGFEEERVFNG